MHLAHKLAALFSGLGVALVGCTGRAEPPAPKQWASPPAMRVDPARQYTATIATSLGELEIALQPSAAPATVNNFVFLAREGFYENVRFHRIMKGFMVQTGDPTGTGRGGPGYTLIDEPVSGTYERGVVAMANTGRPNTNGSQFFIVQGENANLPRNYTIFGKVTTGWETLDQIAAVPVTITVTGEASLPQVDVRITKVTIIER